MAAPLTTGDMHVKHDCKGIVQPMPQHLRQNGFTTTSSTMAIMTKVGNSFIIL